MVISIQNGIDFDTYFYIAVFYLIGVMILSIYSIFTYLRYKRLIKKLSYDVDENFIAVFNKVKKEMNINKNIVVRYCNYIKSPCLIGIFKPCILIPQVEYSNKEISWIMRHELTHYKYKDNLIKLICFLIRIVYWFNPLIYLLIGVVENDCELACDQRVIKNKTFEEKKEYGLTITSSVKYSISLKEKFEKAYFIGFSDSKILKKRLENLFVKKLKSGYFAAILILTVTLSSFINVEFDYLLQIDYYKKNSCTIKAYSYTYKDAPKVVKEFYREECKANGVEPKDSDTFEITEDTLKRLNEGK